MTVLILRPKAFRGLQSAPTQDQRDINEAILILREGGFPPHTKKLGGVPDGYRTRVGRWRILFVLKGGTVDIIDIFVKKERGDYRRRT